VSGWIHSIPAGHGEFTTYELQVETLEGRRPGDGVPALLRLNWSQSGMTPQPGEHWRFTARLRRPRGFMNPGGFDYEAWLMVHGFGATGYVVKDQALHLDESSRYPLLRMRAALRDRIRLALAGDDFSGMVVALATGDQGDIASDQWQVLSATNTVHLMAIAGLHIGVVAGFAFLLVPWLCRRSSWLCSRCPASVAGSVAALLAAVIYAAMAGFPLPTQRALIMLAAGTLGVLLRRRLRPADMLGMALMLVLLIGPLSAIEPGFWLSFAAVAAILYVFSGRPSSAHHWLLELVRTQWAVGIGLLPLLAFFFHQAGLTAPLANLAIVPLYCFLVVPLVLCGAVLSFLWPWAGAGLLKGAALVMAFCWPFLERLAAAHVASLPAPAPGLIACLVALLGAAWLLAPRGIPARWLGAVLLLPLFLTPASGIASGSYEVTLLDVGQGLSTVVRTAGHTLVFDTGPKFYGGTDTGQEVVIPYLQAEGIKAPDLVVVSHGDNDHAGGLASLRAAYPGVPVLSGDAERFAGAEPCERGQHWDWDGIEFTILSPDAGLPYTGNNSSCVLRISGPGGSALFTGDIERPAESRLLAADAAFLRSDLLVAPHHGSNSSSTQAFVTAVAPAVVLFPVGYRNRWGFPKAQVVARYRSLGALLADSADDGAIRVRFTPGLRPAMIMRYRPEAARFWTER
jgi:competence protein ComEC